MEVHQSSETLGWAYMPRASIKSRCQDLLALSRSLSPTSLIQRLNNTTMWYRGHRLRFLLQSIRISRPQRPDTLGSLGAQAAHLRALHPRTAITRARRSSARLVSQRRHRLRSRSPIVLSISRGFRTIIAGYCLLNTSKKRSRMTRVRHGRQ